MFKKRIEWIDVAKAIGIIAVVIGHALPSGNTTQIIYWWHMPLFFIISGFFLKPIKLNQIKSFFNRRIKKDLLVYFGAGAILIALFGLVNGKPVNYLLDYLPNLLWGGRTLNNYTTAFWFVNVYLISITFVTFLVSAIKSRWQQLIIVGTMFIIGCSYDHVSLQINGYNMLPWNVDIALITVLFTYLGYLFMHTNWEWLKKPIVIASLTIASISLIVMKLNGIFAFKMSLKSHMIHSSLPNVVMMATIPLILSFTVFAWSYLITKFQDSLALQFIGQHTMIIMFLHRAILDLCGMAGIHNLTVKIGFALIIPLMLAVIEFPRNQRALYLSPSRI
ncbi:acyltransferase family protein [Lentilactobacillus sp. Marseille-Q4993]|uniref:acyltransferase family protein n=1 Tax=Lentilactobacillus sp. Marseille-Q4993 TaxID=3039492 RepID=UPI0024BD2BE7|nr:acyltransferase family protein [Lentilactobacillus sp. Marseille-Q4993]